MLTSNARHAKAWGSRVVGALVCSLFCVAENASAQAVIKVSDTVNVKFGMLVQAQADWTQDAATRGYQENLFIRRGRLLVGGGEPPQATFFFRATHPHPGRTAAGNTNISTACSPQHGNTAF